MSAKSVRNSLSLLAVAGLSITAHAENNLATVIVDNETSAAASYTYEHMSGTSQPVMGEVNARQNRVFLVTSFADSISGMRFVYASGSKKCRFSVSHTAPPPRYIPTWKKDAVSIGSSRATCTVKMERIGTQMPYHYTVRFTIQ